MTRMTGRIAALSATALLIAGQASAHRAWILPSTFTLSGEAQRITVDAAISNDLFYPNHHALDLDSVSVTAPDGSDVPLEHAASGEYRSVFDVPLTQQGTYKIGSGGSGFFASWEEDGERRRWRGSAEDLAEAGIAEKPGVSLTRSVRRVETFVTLGAPTDTVFSIEGDGLELQPVTHPNDVFADEDVSFGFTLDGAPAAGIEVEIVLGYDRYRDGGGIVTLTSDEDGQITFTPEEPGPYWLSAEAEGTVMFEEREIPSRTSYVMTFEALPF